MHTDDLDLRTGNPLWRSLRHPLLTTHYLDSDIQADVVVIGAGITGAMAAQEMFELGFSVVLLDKRGPLKGSTSATTALLQYDIDVPLSILAKKLGLKNAIRAYRRSKLALDSLVDKINDLELRCDLRRHSSLYIAGSVLDNKGLRAEATQRQSAGLFCQYLDHGALQDKYGINKSGAIVTPDSFSVNPMNMAGGFLRRAIEGGAKIYSPVEVRNVEVGRNATTIKTNCAFSISCKIVIYATGYEMPSFANRRKNKVCSTYAIATSSQPGKIWPDDCLIWEASDPYLYLRSTPDGRVICGGSDEDFENEEMRDALLPKKVKVLEKKLSTLFPHLDAKAEFAWCGSFGSRSSGLPTIGPVPGMKNCYMILAFGGNGITFSRLATELIKARVQGHPDPDEDLFAI